MTREEAINEINKVFTSAYANYIVTALTEGATVSYIQHRCGRAYEAGVKDGLEQNPTTKNDLEVDWESYKDVDGNSLDDLILEILQKNFDCGNTYGYKVADEIIGLLPSVTPQEPKWIPVTERLPEEDGGYLVTVKRGYVTTALWVGNAKNWKEVTAWMPLPKPYGLESESEVEE